MLLELHKQQQNHKDTIKLFHQLCGKGNPFEETDKFHTSQSNWRRRQWRIIIVIYSTEGCKSYRKGNIKSLNYFTSICTVERINHLQA